MEKMKDFTIKKFKKPLFICSGNHDIEELENENWFMKISNVYSDNSIKIINGIKIDIILPTIPLQYSNVLNPKNSITTSISILSSL